MSAWPAPRGRQLVWIVLPLAGVALWLQLGRAGRLWQASHVLGTINAVTAQLGSQRPNLLTKNISLLRDIAKLDPAEVGIPVASAAQYMLLDRPEAAIRAYEEALALEPRAEIYANLGQALLQAKEEEKALAAFRTAVALDHNLAGPLARHLPELQATLRRSTGEPVLVDGFETGTTDRWTGRNRRRVRRLVTAPPNIQPGAKP